MTALHEDVGRDEHRPGRQIARQVRAADGRKARRGRLSCVGGAAPTAERRGRLGRRCLLGGRRCGRCRRRSGRLRIGRRKRGRRRGRSCRSRAIARRCGARSRATGCSCAGGADLVSCARQRFARQPGRPAPAAPARRPWTPDAAGALPPGASAGILHRRAHDPPGPRAPWNCVSVPIPRDRTSHMLAPAHAIAHWMHDDEACFARTCDGTGAYASAQYRMRL